MPGSCVALGRDPILDVGASSGQLGQLLAGSGLTLDGIEPDAASAAVARPHYRSFSVSTVEAADLAGAPYRVIVAADVLEHTPDPTSVLKKLVAASTEDAVFVVSLPNIGHLAARLLVLSGRFPRHDRGIFDRTHLHFYTRDTALELMASAGLSVTTMNATPVPLEDVWPPALGPGASGARHAGPDRRGPRGPHALCLPVALRGSTELTSALQRNACSPLATACAKDGRAVRPTA